MKSSLPDDIFTLKKFIRLTFQRIFNIRQGKGLREHDSNLPYRAMGPVTEKEYLSRQERYDEQLNDLIGIDPTTKTLKEKIEITREYRKDQYNKLQDAVYKKRGWTSGGCPTIELVRDLGIDFDDVIHVIKPFQ